jgi:ubiquinone biosynthesis protein Coq4
MINQNLKTAFIEQVEDYHRPISPLVNAFKEWGNPEVLALYQVASSMRGLEFEHLLRSALWTPVLFSRLAFLLPEAVITFMDRFSQIYTDCRTNQKMLLDDWRNEWNVIANQYAVGERRIPPELLARFWEELDSDGVGRNIIEVVTNYTLSYDEILREAYRSAMYQRPALVSAMQEGYIHPPININDLAVYAEGTVGKIFYHQIVDNGLQVEILKPNQTVSLGNDIADYSGKRILQTHDLWHVVTGYTTDGVDEIALQAFQLAQLGSSFSSNLLATILTRSTLLNPQITSTMLKAIVYGWQHGRETVPFLPIKWETMWDVPVEEVRQRYQIRPYTGGLVPSMV